MPRNGSGIYSKPTGTTAAANTTIESAKYNSTIDDLVTDANAARPVSAGGTGGTTAAAGRTALGLVIGTDVQAYDADLAAIAGLTSAADKIPYFDGSESADLLDKPAGVLVGTTETQTLTNKTVTGLTLDGKVTEEVFAVTGTTPAIAATNGTIQTWTLSANSTPTDSLAAGESITLMIDDGTAYTVTWTSLVDQWAGGSAPTLATTGYTGITLFKIGSTVYGMAMGDFS